MSNIIAQHVYGTFKTSSFVAVLPDNPDQAAGPTGQPGRPSRDNPDDEGGRPIVLALATGQPGPQD